MFISTELWIQLSLATLIAPSDISTASIFELVFLAIVIAIHPEPVPISKTLTCLLNVFLIYLIVFSTNSSVSNLGISTSLFTYIIFP